MTRTYDWNDMRAHGRCADRGHAFKRVDGNRVLPANYRCQCGATAEATETGLTLNVPRFPKTLEEQAAKRAARKAKHERP